MTAAIIEHLDAAEQAAKRHDFKASDASATAAYAIGVRDYVEQIERMAERLAELDTPSATAQVAVSIAIHRLGCALIDLEAWNEKHGVK